MMLEVGRVSVAGAANERLLAEETERVMQSAGLEFGPRL
jgi:ATP-dependent Lhr-like helicase